MAAGWISIRLLNPKLLQLNSHRLHLTCLVTILGSRVVVLLKLAIRCTIRTSSTQLCLSKINPLNNKLLLPKMTSSLTFSVVFHLHSRLHPRLHLPHPLRWINNNKFGEAITTWVSSSIIIWCKTTITMLTTTWISSNQDPVPIRLAPPWAWANNNNKIIRTWVINNKLNSNNSSTLTWWCHLNNNISSSTTIKPNTNSKLSSRFPQPPSMTCSEQFHHDCHHHITSLGGWVKNNKESMLLI